MNKETFEELIPAYALGALDANERAEFEALLASNPEAQQLVAEYQATADLLVLTAPARPAPPHLRDDLRRRLAAQRKVVPIEADARKSASRWVQLGALAAILAVVLGVVWLLSREQTSPARQLFDSLLAQPNVVRVALAPQPGFEQISGELVALPDSTQAVIRVANMPPLDQEHAFQLWFADEEGLQSSLTFRAASGETYVIVPVEEAISAYQAFAVSIEPPEGSPDPNQPSGPVVFTVPTSPA